MQMKLLRKEAVKLAAFIEIFQLSLSKQKEYIESALTEAGIENVSEAKESFYLRDYVEYKLKFVTNSYLEKIISNKLKATVTIEGKPPRLFKCPCCAYKTLKRRGHFEICPICFWEDNGVDENEDYSSPNHMTLKEGKQNFDRYGSADLKCINSVEQDRTKYEQ
jgi:Cysteine-rich CPCC